MPVYEFRCKDCRRVFSLSYGSYDDYEQATPACPGCRSTDLSRLIRKVSFMTPEETRMERLADPSRLAGLDENDPRSMGRVMRQMASESGEDLGPEFGEVVDRLEAGESPESIEQSMPLDSLDSPMGGGIV
ncbi:MAG: zinc ribbon domain-containing protein [Anaerolineae bacterium]|nr:zinc ribbon domain-containing protein [Anaerolineae bacterium]